MMSPMLCRLFYYHTRRLNINSWIVKFIYANDAWFKLCGAYPSILYEEIDWSTFVPPDDLKIVQKALETVVETKSGVNFACRLKIPWTGEGGMIGETWFQSSAHAVLHKDGSVKEIMGAMTGEILHPYGRSY
jgi:hypothetical protein